jgi:hypothetical protein
MDALPDYLHTISLPTPFPVGPVNILFAISEVIGHPQWLELEGRVRRTERRGPARWQVEEA